MWDGNNWERGGGGKYFAETQPIKNYPAWIIYMNKFFFRTPDALP
jgi:hypothetical protein